MLSLRAPVEPVGEARADRARILLERALGASKVLSDRAACERFARDESEALGEVPQVVVLAETAGDVAETLRVARESGVPVTPRAGGTGKTGGAVPVAGGIVLSTRALSRILEIDRDDGVCVVEPGVILGELHAAVEAEGLFYAPDPNSAASCCLGGNLAENAGGPRAVKYGVTRDWVTGCEVALVGGSRLTLGRRTAKGVTGYDLVSTFVGSEGTLGVFTQATLRLVPRPEAVVTLLALFRDAVAAGAAVPKILRSGAAPRCMELLDKQTMDAVRARGVSLREDAAGLLLLEVDGDEGAVLGQAERIGAACDEAGALAVVVAQAGAERTKLWEARRQMSPAVRALARRKLSEDVVVPRSQVPELLRAVGRISAETRVRMLSYGHAGDGNFHVNFLWDDDDEIPRVEAAILALFREVLALRGTLSGEHGIGVLKAPYLHLEQSEAVLDAQLAVKRAFDPEGLLNPGKLFWPRSHRAC